MHLFNLLKFNGNEIFYLITTDPYRMVVLNVFSSFILVLGVIIYRFIFPKRKINLFILLVAIAVLPTLSLFRPGTFNAGDMRAHTAQFIDFYYNLQAGNILPQWAANLCGGYGCPVYEIEYILPYYIASFFHVLGISFLTSLKLMLATAFIASGITMYLWAKDEFGEVSGFVGAIFYLFAPYHLIDLHFRGSVGEVLSFVFIPLLFLFTNRFIQTKQKKYFFLEALAVVCILLSHSSTTIIVLPITIGYALIKWLQKKNRKFNEIILYFASIGYGLALSAAYWIPAITEVKYTWWSTVTFGDFQPIWKLLFSPIAYGFLFQGHHGEYRLIIGYSHILMILAALLFLFRNKFGKFIKSLLIYFIMVFFLLFFMMLNMSTPIWQNISLLHTFIMVWRLLVPISFISSAIAAIVITKINRNWLIVILCLFTIVSTVLNWGNRKMVPPLTNPFLTTDAVYTEYFESGKTDYIQEYKDHSGKLDKIMANPPLQPMQILTGQGKFYKLQRTPSFHQYIVEADTNIKIKENTEYFPGWEVHANNIKIPIKYEEKKSNSFGKITFDLKKGLYLIDVNFTDTPIRNFSKKISLIFLIIGFLYLLLIQSKKLSGR